MAPNYMIDGDFVGTISDGDEDIPDYEAAGQSGVDDELNPSSKKRKREAPKKTKKSKKQKTALEDEDEEAAATEGDAAGQDPADELDPHFEFEVGAVAGDVVDGWDFGKKDEAANGVGIDEIIARRRQKQQDESTEKDVEDDEENDDDLDMQMRQTLDGDEELLASDGFGMGASNQDEDGSLEENASEEDAEEDQAGSDDGAEDEEAEPQAHPDDLMFESDDENEEEDKEDPEEQAKRDAFFAPEDTSTKTSKGTSDTSFLNMSVSRPILKGISSLGFTAPTPIQSKAIPVALLGKDVVGGAVTGSGKTAAFVIPILERLLYRSRTPTTRVAILMPTRELAVQCYNVATKLASFTDITFALIVGGLSLREQEQTLKRRPDVVIATPGRFIDHMRNTASFAVQDVEILVLDEADRMLEDGFADELNEIVTTIPRKRQTMLFSATMTEDIDKLIRVGMSQPVRLMVDSKKQTVSGLVQEFVKLKPSKSGSGDDTETRRLASLLHLCTYTYTSKVIVFLPTKHLAHRVKVLFALHGLGAAELHGSMSQEQRLQAISAFRDGRATHLLATDLAARGLDIPRVESVINFTVPTQAATYIHRVGRTARAGRQGVACTLFASSKDGKSSSTGKKQSKAASERTLLRPIMKIAKDQKAVIRTRTLPVDALAALTSKVAAEHEEVDAILREEKEEKLLAQTERDMRKGENLIKYEDEIASRPKRTWFQTEKEKEAASKAGMAERKGLDGESTPGKEKKRLSGKMRKKLEDRDQRKDGPGMGWKKRKDERGGGGVLQSSKDRAREKKKGASAGAAKAGGKPKSKGGRPRTFGKGRIRK